MVAVGLPGPDHTLGTLVAFPGAGIELGQLGTALAQQRAGAAFGLSAHPVGLGTPVQVPAPHVVLTRCGRGYIGVGAQITHHKTHPTWSVLGAIRVRVMSCPASVYSRCLPSRTHADQSLPVCVAEYTVRSIAIAGQC